MTETSYYYFFCSFVTSYLHGTVNDHNKQVRHEMPQDATRHKVKTNQTPAQNCQKRISPTLRSILYLLYACHIQGSHARSVNDSVLDLFSTPLAGGVRADILADVSDSLISVI